MSAFDTDGPARPDGPVLQTAAKSDVLALLGAQDAPAPVISMRAALQASRETSLRLARGRPQALVRTYSARLSDAQAQGVPTVGIPALLEALAEHPEDHVWGFTVRDNTMIYVGFADADLRHLVGVVIMARRGAESMMAG